MKNKPFDDVEQTAVYAASEIIDGVRMYPFVCDHGKRQYLVDIERE